MFAQVARIAFVLTLALGAVLLLTGCDNRPCEQGHYNYIPMVHHVGKSVYTSITPVWVCDVYGPEPKKSNG